MDEMKAKILDYVREEYLDEDDEIEMDENTPLISSGIVDSFSMVSLKTFLETSYAIQIPDEKAGSDAFDSVAKIVALVEEIRGG